MTPLRPANAPDMPARRDPPGRLSLVPPPLWHPRCGHSPTNEELNALIDAINAATDRYEAAQEVANTHSRERSRLQVLLDRAYERVRADGDEVVPESEVRDGK